MTALGEVCTVKEIAPNAGVKMLHATTPITAIGGTDTVQIDLNDYGCTKISAILGFDDDTAGSVVSQEQPTTVVTSGVLVITLGGNETVGKTFIIWAY